MHLLCVYITQCCPSQCVLLESILFKTESILCRNWYKKKRQKHIFQFPTVYMYMQYNILISLIIDFKEQTWIFITKISKINILVEHPESINFHFEKHASAIHIILHNIKRISRIRCICCSCHIKSPQNRGLSHHSDATNYDLNCNSATHKHLYERLTAFCTIYKGPKMNRSWLFVCFATLRLLQCFTCTIFVLLVSFNLSCFATILIILSILSISVSDHNRPWMLLIVSCIQLCPQKSVGNCRYEYPLWLSRSLVTWNTWLHERPTSIRMDTRSIVQSPNHSRFYRIIWQNLLSLYNSRMQKQDISQDLMCLHRTTFAFERANFVVRILFSKAIISATVYDTNLNLSMARIFFRFCLCTDCERAFNNHTLSV